MHPLTSTPWYSPWEPGLFSLAVFTVLVLGVIAALLIISSAIGERRPGTEKLRAYESGVIPTGSARLRYPVPFYLVAIFFLLFDIEGAFIFSWAVAFRELGWNGWLEIVFFIVMQILGLVYVWKKGGLTWGPTRRQGLSGRLFNGADILINWARQYSLWPMFFGLSCCFVEEAAVFTARYDMARFGAEVLRPSPRQADLLITSGTIFKKIAPVVLRLYEQMAEPKWVISMGSCSNCGGMYDAYSVVQGIDQILPVDVYIPGCPPRPEAILAGADDPAEEDHVPGAADPLGPQPGGRHPGDPEAHPRRRPHQVPRPARPRHGRASRSAGPRTCRRDFPDSRSDLMWTPPARRIVLNVTENDLSHSVVERFGEAVRPEPHPADMPTFEVAAGRVKEVLRYLKHEAEPALPAARGPDRRGRVGPARPRRCPGLHPGLPPARLRPAHPAAPEGAAARNGPHRRQHHRHLALRQLVRARGLRPHGRALRGPPEPAAADHARGLAGAPPAQEHPGPRHRDGAVHPGGCAPASARRRRDVRAPDGGPAPVGAQRRAASREHPRPDPLHPHPGRAKRSRGWSWTSATITGPWKRSASARPGTSSSPTRTAWTTWPGPPTTCPTCRAVETLAGIRVPERAQVIRVLLSELFRLSNHLVWFSTYAHDVGAMSPTFYAFREREMILDIVELITGGRLHPSWFRIGGVAADLPEGWKEAVDQLVTVFPKRLDEYETLTRKNPIFKARTQGIGRISQEEADRLGRHRAEPARLRPGVGPAQEVPLFGLRSVRVRGADRGRRRLLRALPRARGGDAPEHPDHRAGGRQHAGRPLRSPTITVT